MTTRLQNCPACGDDWSDRQTVLPDGSVVTVVFGFPILTACGNCNAVFHDGKPVTEQHIGELTRAQRSALARFIREGQS